MTKNIGILTFHYTNNHGAVLQAYALRKVINSFSECHAEIINYVPKGLYYSLSPGDGLEKLRGKLEKFRQFLFDYCGVRTPMIHSVTGNTYDAYIVGSDMVWNTDFREVTTDYAYFLPDLDDTVKKIAYSASIGLEPDKIDRSKFQKYLSRFDYISLREKAYTQIISELAGMKCECTLDPTMLLDRTDYETIIEQPNDMEHMNITKEPYVFYLWYDRGDGGGGGIEMVNAIARKYELTIKHTFMSEKSIARQMLVKDGGCMLQCGIGEFLWYVKNAAVVVTNSFHGAIFSMLFKRPLYIYYQEPWKCRQENLVDIFHLENRAIEGYLSPDKLNLEINYEMIFHVLEREREHSIHYLKKAIGIV